VAQPENTGKTVLAPVATVHKFAQGYPDAGRNYMAPGFPQALKHWNWWKFLVWQLRCLHSRAKGMSFCDVAETRSVR
jgi:hypothetical protein